MFEVYVVKLALGVFGSWTFVIISYKVSAWLEGSRDELEKQCHHVYYVMHLDHGPRPEVSERK